MEVGINKKKKVVELQLYSVTKWENIDELAEPG